MVDRATHYVRSSKVAVRRVAGETILVPFDVTSSDLVTRTAEFFVLNPTAELLWERLATAQNCESLARNLMDAYAVSAERAEADVDAFVHSMLEIGAIQPSESRD
jgi:coenzyme PQQ synthesis protein D (PqqD)